MEINGRGMKFEIETIFKERWMQSAWNQNPSVEKEEKEGITSQASKVSWKIETVASTCPQSLCQHRIMSLKPFLKIKLWSSTC